MPHNQNQPQLEKLIGVKFKDPQILNQALIHRSYLNENKNLKLPSNERYEFLGDAVLEMWISETLFKMFPQYSEGDLTNLRALIVCTQNLALVSTSYSLGEYIYLSRGEETHGGRTNTSILADTFEAVLGAIFLDRGYKVSFKFLNTALLKNVTEISKQKIYKDPKSIFQEIAQEKRGVTPHYQTISESGPDHQKTFEVGVFLNDEMIASGTGNSKQKAEENASQKATKIISC